MNMLEIIRKKRDGLKLTEEELKYVVEGYIKGEIPDYQMSAFLMAVFFKHLDEDETYTLTEIMARSGDYLDLSDIPGKKVDKHSTGGVGDKTTLVVGPMVAALGLNFAKLSGRALGHSGGTIDKLESIPGFRTSLDREEFVEGVKKVGVVISGQTGNIAPADKKIYALRDVTATVDEISLIASSIMSKKLAVGSDAMVIDVKVGSGAFMKNMEDARKLANLLVKIGKMHGRKTVALLTDMDQPLGRMVGNALEVLEAVETLQGHGPEDFETLCVEIAANMLVLGEVYSKLERARMEARKVLKDGRALEKFKQMVEYQSGNPRVVDDPENVLTFASNIVDVKAQDEGFVDHINAEKVGMAVVMLGGGRTKKDERIDHSVGVEILKKRGDKVKKGDVIARIYASDFQKIQKARELVEEAYHFTSTEPAKVPIIHGVIA